MVEGRVLGTTTLNVGYQFDDGDTLSVIIYPDGTMFDYGYDLAGRTRAMTVTGSATIFAQIFRGGGLRRI